MKIDIKKIQKKPARDKWDKRNNLIYDRFKKGETVEELSVAFALSESRINEVIRQFSYKDMKTSAVNRTGKTNILIPNIIDTDISAKTRNKLMRFGVMYIKDLDDKMEEIENSGEFSDKLIAQFKEVVSEWKNK